MSKDKVNCPLGCGDGGGGCGGGGIDKGGHGGVGRF